MTRSLRASRDGREKAVLAFKRRGWTQEYLAGASQCSRQTVWKFFGKRYISTTVFKAICEVLSLKWSEIAELELEVDYDSLESDGIQAVNASSTPFYSNSTSSNYLDNGLNKSVFQEIAHLISITQNISIEQALARIDTNQYISVPPAPFDKVPLFEKLYEAFRSEVTTSLLDADIFSKYRFQEAFKRIHDNPLFLRKVGLNKTIIHFEEQSLNQSDLLGVGWSNSLKFDFENQQPLNVVLSHALPGSILIFEYLRLFRGLKLNLDFRMSSSAETVERLKKGQFPTMPDICVLGLGPATSLVQEQNPIAFSPVMIMPKGSHRIVTLNNTKQTKPDISRGIYQFMRQRPASSAFFFEDLIEKDIISQDNISIEDTSVEDTFEHFLSAESDLRAILVFPHYFYFDLAFNCSQTHAGLSKYSNKESILFLSESLFRNESFRSTFSLFIRDAWMELRTQPLIRDMMVELLLHRYDYLRTLIRFSGFHSLPFDHFSSLYM